MAAAAVLILSVTAAHADAPAEALLQKCVDAETKMKSLQATFTLRLETGTDTRVLHGVMKLQKPNKALITLQGSQASDTRTLASDGRQFTIYYSSDNEFQREAADPSGGNVGRVASTEVTAFFNPDVLNQIRAQGTGAKIAGGNVGFDLISVSRLSVAVLPDGVLYASVTPCSSISGPMYSL